MARAIAVEMQQKLVLVFRESFEEVEQSIPLHLTLV
jgi:hypothetical protein